MTRKQEFTMLQMLKVIVIGMIAVALITLFCGCKTVTKVVEVEKVRTDTMYQHHTDSVIMRDSVIEHQTTTIRELDSAAMAKYGIQLKNAERAWLIQTDLLRRELSELKEAKIDTVYISKTDSTKVEKTETVIQKESKWKRLGKMIGQMLLVLLMLFAVYCIIKIAQHFEKRLP